MLVDDFIGQGGTLANLRGHLLQQGARVIGATVLTGKLHSVKVALSLSTLDGLRRKHGPELERWWEDRFGYASTASLNQRLAISSAPRMLTASEIVLLRKSMSEIAARIEEQFEPRDGKDS